MDRATTPRPRPQLIIVSYFKSQGRVNNTGVTRSTICCHIDYYMIESCHNGFKVMYMHMSIFSVFRSFTVCCEQVFHVLLIFQHFLVLSMVGCKINLRDFECNKEKYF